MKRNFTRVLGIGEGKRLRKSVDLSVRHPKTEFVALEKAKMHELDVFGYLKEKGIRTKPQNLTIKAGIAGEKYLAEQRPNSFDHIYSHFLTQHMSFESRRELFRQVARTLKPGSRFVIIEMANYEKTLEMELRNAGLKVSKRRMTPEELFKLSTDNGNANAKSAANAKHTLDVLRRAGPSEAAKILSRTNSSARTIEELFKVNQSEVRLDHTNLFLKNNPNPSKEALDSLKLIRRGITPPDNFLRPFTVITAKKSSVKKI
jgi:SAM-dependent methyltransferase